jgi:iron complex transport system permease protein
MTESSPSLRRSGSFPGLIPILVTILVAAALVSLSLGRYPIPLSALVARLFGRPFDSSRVEAVLFNVRLPRVLMACLVGTSLAAAGASYQGVFQNPLAAPDILGASSGAATGATLAILLRLPGYLVTAFAFCASLVTIAAVMLVGERARGRKIIGLILAGLMISSLHSTAASFMKLVADPNNVLPEIVYWLMGSLAKTKPEDVSFVIVPMALGLLPLLAFRWRINILTLSEEEAQSVGINTRAFRALVIICGTLVTAAAVSVSGVIGWAGLIIPHLARRIAGNNYQDLMPVSMLTGALFLLVIDNISRNLFATEVPLGILTSLAGAPFFLWLITRKGEPL